MLDIVDVIAVREAVERQSLVRQRICRRLLDGRTQEEIAAELRLSQGTVSRHIRRIRQALREMGFEP